MNGLTMIGYNIGSRIVGRVVKSLSGLQPGQRYPHPEWGPIVVPKTPDLEAGDPTLRRTPLIKITFQGFVGLSAALLWYAHRSTEPLAALPEQKELFPELKRELSLKAEDTAESDDPVEICLQRRYGWKLDRLTELRESIADKSQPGLYEEEGEEKLTSAEQELLENIDACLEEIKEEHGSLEAAGLELIDCPLCDDD